MTRADRDRLVWFLRYADQHGGLTVGPGSDPQLWAAIQRAIRRAMPTDQPGRRVATTPPDGRHA
jgi:hypothetical protein